MFLLDFLKKNRYILILFAFTIVGHLEWFNPGSFLFHGDWRLWPDENISRFINGGYGAYFDDQKFGYQNVQVYFNFIFFLWGIIGSYIVATKATLLIPIAIFSVLAPFFLVRKLTGNEKVAFVSALVFSSFTTLLKLEMAHLFIAFVFSFSPVIILFFIRLLERVNLRNVLLFSFVYSLGCYMELRIMYVVTIILFAYLLFFIKKENIRKEMFVTPLVILLLNLFWILPTVFGDKSTISSITGRGLFGSQFFDIFYSFTNFEKYWTGGEIEPFVRQAIPFICWMLPLFSFGVLFFLKSFKDYKSKKTILFFSLVSVIGILLSKQAGEPFTGLYEWLYQNFPGFNLFREASKFFLLVSVGYLGLFAFMLLYLFKNHQILFKIVAVFFILLAIFNFKPLINREASWIFVKKIRPPEYDIFYSFILSQQEYFRTLWIPRDSQWGYYNFNKPKVSLTSIYDQEWSNFYDKKNFSRNFSDFIFDPFFNVYGDKLTDVSAIKYFIIPLSDDQEQQNVLGYYRSERNDYINVIKKIKFLNKIEINGIKDLVVYENENYRPHIYVTKEKETIYWEVPYEKVEFEQKNPTQYKISLKNVSLPVYLNFSESFHPDWKLRAGDFNWLRAIMEKNYFLPDDFHAKNNANLNSFKIDPEFIKQNHPGSYTENPDGSINLDLILYFKSQSYFYLGLIISSATLVGCLGYLAYDFSRRKRKNFKGEEKSAKAK